MILAAISITLSARVPLSISALIVVCFVCIWLVDGLLLKSEGIWTALAATNAITGMSATWLAWLLIAIFV
ncbi:MAG: hypothetical protein LBK99_00730 [Opitutaceae bacterium]|jgi:hypothetical protein|nr:hypothetical protein [Opitutaceae bacterium]